MTTKEEKKSDTLEGYSKDTAKHLVIQSIKPYSKKDEKMMKEIFIDKYPYLQKEKYIEFLTKILTDRVDIKTLKRGDLLDFYNEEHYNDGLLVWNGKELEDLTLQRGDYIFPNIPVIDVGRTDFWDMLSPGCIGILLNFPTEFDKSKFDIVAIPNDQSDDPEEAPEIGKAPKERNTKKVKIYKVLISGKEWNIVDLISYDEDESDDLEFCWSEEHFEIVPNYPKENTMFTTRLIDRWNGGLDF